MNAATAHQFLFYAPDFRPPTNLIELTGDEHHHLTRVLRLGAGDSVHVTNGLGTIALCRIEAMSREAASLSVLKLEENDPAVRPVILALALLKKDAFARAVEQCTELGITRCVPFISEKCHVRSYSAGFIDRIRRIALSAMKQSFRAVLPEIENAIGLGDLAQRMTESPVAIVGDANGGDVPTRPAAGPLMIVVGPEGGFSGEELEAFASAGARSVRASAHRLRSETAAACLVALALSESSAGPDPHVD
jgi:16S rRNA (uracil1498-N3)-methyltransferase